MHITTFFAQKATKNRKTNFLYMFFSCFALIFSVENKLHGV